MWTHADSPLGTVGETRRIHKKGVTVRFGFDVLELRNLYGLSKAKQRERPMGCICPNMPPLDKRPTMVYTYIGVGLSALLVPTIRAMRRP